MAVVKQACGVVGELRVSLVLKADIRPGFGPELTGKLRLKLPSRLADPTQPRQGRKPLLVNGSVSTIAMTSTGCLTSAASSVRATGRMAVASTSATTMSPATTVTWLNPTPGGAAATSPRCDPPFGVARRDHRPRGGVR